MLYNPLIWWAVLLAVIICTPRVPQVRNYWTKAKSGEGTTVPLSVMIILPVAYLFLFGSFAMAIVTSFAHLAGYPLGK